MREFFTKNITIKIISLILAIALWMFVVGEETAEIGLTIPLEIINVPSDLVVTNDVIQDLNVRVSGPRRLIRRIASENLSKIIDLKGVQPGEIGFEIVPEDLPLPGGVKVTRLSPSTVTIQVEKIESKKLNILPVLQGSPKKGYEVVSVKFKPDTVTVTGPSKELATLDAVWTKPINVEKKTDSFTQPVTLEILSNQISTKTQSPVEVEVAIEPRIITKSFSNIPVKAIASIFRYEIQPDKVDVRLMGPSELLSNLDQEKDLEALLDLMKLAPGDYVKKPTLKFPKGLTLLDITPPVVDVKILDNGKGE